MERHGSETYFVLGETVGGRDRTLASELEAQTKAFRFSRLGPRARSASRPSRSWGLGAVTAISDPTDAGEGSTRGRLHGTRGSRHRTDV